MRFANPLSAGAIGKRKKHEMFGVGRIAGRIYMIISKYMVFIFNMEFLFPTVENAGFLQ
jgi:hypothetical protein